MQDNGLKHIYIPRLSYVYTSMPFRLISLRLQHNYKLIKPSLSDIVCLYIAVCAFHFIRPTQPCAMPRTTHCACVYGLINVSAACVVQHIPRPNPGYATVTYVYTCMYNYISDRVRGNQAFVIRRYGRSKLLSYTSEVSFFALRGSLMIVES